MEERHLSLLTANLLAPCNNRYDGGHKKESADQDAYTRRNIALADLLVSAHSDIICVQEFWFELSLMEIYTTRFQDTHTTYKTKRPGTKQDGLVCFVHKDVEVVKFGDLNFADVGQRAAQFLHVRVTSSDGQYMENAIVVNTHLAVPEQAWDEQHRQEQIAAITGEVDKYLKQEGLEAVCFILGDLNGMQHIQTHLADKGYYIAANVEGEESAEAHAESTEVTRTVTHKTEKGGEVEADYVLFRPSASTQVVLHRCVLLPAQYPPSPWPAQFTLSDHRPLLVELALVRGEAGVEPAE
eukprot:comp19592_c0_seq1/m.23056 comp19592_c0_seq1/g.23056  ORF comp19592_c0_seq1/g.23056 comp19592_c0_seq1/m.23056 type:complete len:297 (-) comp19592_c0_seq1:49-939(-)